jgi:sugar (pentulose or hexulose) kinase
MRVALHLPQYVAYLLHGQPTTDITSIGCHTMLWDFRKNDYHDWVKAEGLIPKFAPLVGADCVFPLQPVAGAPAAKAAGTGTGLHDSSAALIPYLAGFDEPFLLISTGTWCISLNAFNDEPLTAEELAQDCLCYLTYAGRPVKAARYFGGHEHEQACRALAERHGVGDDFPRSIDATSRGALADDYRAFMSELVEKQVRSTRLALGRSPVRRIFVDGGFSKNALYLALLAQAFPDLEVCAAEVAQATALGAALALHATWNTRPVPKTLITWAKNQPETFTP